jgi:hypothetical protein
VAAKAAKAKAQKVARPIVVRERRKVGRPPIGAIAMLPRERVARHRLQKRLQALIAPERHQAGTVQPLPHRLPVPANLLTKGNDEP